MERDPGAVKWGEFAAATPDLARFGAGLLKGSPAFLATIRADGRPRVHPVTPVITSAELFVFMEPTSPKARDIRDRHWYAIHNGVPDDAGTGGEFHLLGRGTEVEDADVWTYAADAASYEPANRYILFELLVSEARCNGYGDVALPEVKRWIAAG
ncbi:MAG TPA: pyridoxamine 5'-phosphate oxidase family protein [Acidimicrobiia bacterium]|nr:pyridoxamine 5'-phosphate oxidase family protein [Acidimicrobiia bacterium]